MNPPTARAGTASCSLNLGSVLGAGAVGTSRGEEFETLRLRRFFPPLV